MGLARPRGSARRGLSRRPLCPRCATRQAPGTRTSHVLGKSASDFHHHLRTSGGQFSMPLSRRPAVPEDTTSSHKGASGGPTQGQESSGAQGQHLVAPGCVCLWERIRLAPFPSTIATNGARHLEERPLLRPLVHLRPALLDLLGTGAAQSCGHCPVGPPGARSKPPGPSERPQCNLEVSTCQETWPPKPG